MPWSKDLPSWGSCGHGLRSNGTLRTINGAFTGQATPQHRGCLAVSVKQTTSKTKGGVSSTAPPHQKRKTPQTRCFLVVFVKQTTTKTRRAPSLARGVRSDRLRRWSTRPSGAAAASSRTAPQAAGRRIASSAPPTARRPRDWQTDKQKGETQPSSGGSFASFCEKIGDPLKKESFTTRGSSNFGGKRKPGHN